MNEPSQLVQHVLGIGALFGVLVVIPIIRRSIVSERGNPMLAALLLFAALMAVSLVYCSQAHAATYDQGTAWAACKGYEASGTYANTACYDYPSQNTVKLQTIPGGSWTYQSFSYSGTCASRSALSGGLAVPFDYSAAGSPVSVCYSGCAFALAEGSTSVTTYVVDGVTWSVVDGFTPLGGVCDEGDVSSAPTDTDGDGVSDSLDAFPNDPLEATDTDGDGIGDNADIAPNDPANGEDIAGEEDGDDEGDNSATGGGDCSSAPVCTGDGIACNTNFQAWKTRCAVESSGGKVTGSPGDCGSSYTCEGAAVACAQLAVQRTAMCADGDGEGDDEGGTVAGGESCSQPYTCTGGDAIACQQLREAHQTRCLFESDGGDDEDYGAELDPGDYIGVGQGEGVLDLDAGGWLGGGSCPSIVSDTFEFEGASDAFCSGGEVLGYYVLFLAYLGAARIIGRSVTGGA